jgi:hypothetical protein
VEIFLGLDFLNEMVMAMLSINTTFYAYVVVCYFVS